MVISDPRTTAIFTHCIVVISCHQYTKVGDLQAMTAMTLLDDSRNWGHFWKIKSIDGRYEYSTYAILNLCVPHHDVKKHGLHTQFTIPLLGLSWGHFGLALQQRCGERRPNKHFLWHATQSVSCFSLKPLCCTLSWPLCAFQWSLTSPLDWVEATLDSHCLEQSIASTAPFVPIRDSIHPYLLRLSLLYH
jgi:hypothetical protein